MAPGRSITSSTTAVINRALAAYCVVWPLSNLPFIVQQLSTTAAWWTASMLPAYTAISVAMLVQAVRRRPIRRLCGAYAVCCLVALGTGVMAFAPRGEGSTWLWWTVAQSVVAAALWSRSTLGATAYAMVLAVLYAVTRGLPGFGGAPLETAVSDGLFILVCGLPLAITALGMIRASEDADRLARDVSRQQLEEELGRTLAAERARLDRLIHDDVLTALTAGAHADDGASRAAAGRLARSTLTKIDALESEGLEGGLVPGEVLVRLVQETLEPLSPSVRFVAGEDEWADLTVPTAQARALVAALREAVRNAVRHAGATTISVTADRRPLPDGDVELVVEVFDDGRGFVPDEVDPLRLGLRLSVEDRMRQVGGRAEVRSGPGEGTAVALVLRRPGQDLPTEPYVRGDQPALPAAFPTGVLTALVWMVAVIQLGQGVYYSGVVRHQVVDFLGMALFLAAVAVMLHAGDVLRLPARLAALVAVLVVVSAVLSTSQLPTDDWPGYGMWLPYPLQFVIVVLVLRQRGWVALVTLAGATVVQLAWGLRSDFVFLAFSSAVVGPVLFSVMAWFVNRGLLGITRRQRSLRRQWTASLHQAAQSHVGRVQRALWADDLRRATAGPLQSIADPRRRPDATDRTEYLLLEATLRETLMARNVMNEELAELAQRARRRGVSVTFVDSRSTPASPVLRTAVLAAVTDALARQAVARVVVRMAPDRSSSAASVLSSGDGPVRLTALDRDGLRLAELNL